MSRRSLGLLLVLCGSIFIEGIDVAMLSLALPAIRDDLGLSTGGLQWVMSAYVLAYGGLVLLGGRAADLLGRRRMFLLWLTVFLLFSGLGGLATDGWMLVVARFVTGAAAAFITPAGLSIITTTFPEGPQRQKALLVYAGTAAAGFSLGLVAGGLLTAVDWRWVFFAPLALAGVILAAAVRLVPDDGRPDARARGFDLAGAATLTAGMVALVYGVVRLEEPGHGPGWTAAVLAGGAALLAAFVGVERRAPAPLVRLGVLRSASLVRANLSALLFGGSFLGFQFLIVLYMQELRGWSALETSFALLVVSIDAVLAPTVTPRLVDRFGNARLIVAGLAMATTAYALFVPVGLDWAYAVMFPIVLLLGLAFALAYGPLTIVATEGVADDEQGLAGGLLYASWQFGAALGLSAVTAVSVAVTGDGGSTAAALDGIRAGLVVPVAMAALATLTAATALGRGGRPRQGVV
jgi:MFS family permease